MKAIDKAMVSGASVLALSLGLAAPSVGHAQTAVTGSSATTPTTTGASPAANLTATQPTSLGEVVVTARKRVERLIDVPVSITAFTAADIATKDIQTLGDIAAYTPGLTDDQANGGGARSDRSFQQLIIRGMNPSSTQNPNSSVFINGVPVAAADFLQNLDDVSRVEVLKGPQSAYFGRETFAGAVNVVSAPAGDTLSSNFSAEVGTRSTHIVSGTVTVPVLGDKLSVRAGGFLNEHDGSYKNAADLSETLGDQKTYGGHVAVTAKPIDNLTIKAFGLIFRDNDGPPATGILLSSPGAFNQGNCTLQGSPYFCGKLPNVISSVSPAQNDTITPALQAFFNNPGGVIKKSNLVEGYGLRRDAYHGDMNVDYVIPSLGLTLTYLGGFNRDNWSEVSDLSNEDGAANGQYPGYPGFAFAVEQAAHDFSHEVRIASDPTRRYRLLLGASYVSSYTQSALSPAGFGIPASDSGAMQSKTKGVFFSLAYDILPPLTLTFDGRYQSDKEKAFTPAGPLQAEGTSSDFLPRVSLQYKIQHNLMVYFTYSEGVNPGTFNTQILSLPAASVAKLQGIGGAGQITVMPEHLTNYEGGVKGSFWHNRATLIADVYYDKWSDQLNLNSYNFAADDPTNPYNITTGSQYVPNNTSIYTFAYTDNSAKSTAKGLEFEGDLTPMEHLDLNLSGAINDTTYDSFACGVATCYPYATTYNAAGKHLPNSPEYSLNAGAQYGTELSVLGARDWYVRGDFIYRSGIYTEPTNDNQTQDVEVLNVRGGVNWSNFSIEGYVNNVTNNKAFNSGFGDVNFGGFFSSTAIMVGLPQLITGGVRVRAHF